MLKKTYKLRDGTLVTVGEYTLSGLLQIQNYPEKSIWGWQKEIWRQHQHNYGDPGHRLKLARFDKRAKRNRNGGLPSLASWYSS